MSTKRADHFKGAHKHQQFLKWLEKLRAQLRDPNSLSDVAFQAIAERGCHPKFAVLVSTSGGKAYDTQADWRAGFIAHGLQFDASEAASKSNANGNKFTGNGNGHNNGKKNGKFKFAAKGGVKKKDTSHYICRLCNQKGHGPWDKNDKGNWVCPKKVSGLADRPSFIPPGQPPLLSLTVDVARGWQLPVEVFKLETVVGTGRAAGQPRTYYLVQNDLFRRRGRGDMYSFADEGDMLTWLAVFNKAVAAVVLAEGVTHMQLHDYHGALSLQYLPGELRPAVVYVAHNAHYDATFPIPTPERKRQVYEHLNLTPEAAACTEHNGSLDVLRGAVTHLRDHQQGCGVVAVSPRYAAQISKKLSCFWDLVAVGRPDAGRIRGITNALDTCGCLAAGGMPLHEVLGMKAASKVQLQQLYGLSTGQQHSLATFVGRMTQQKGCDIIAEVAEGLLARYPLLQLVVVGPAGDPIGTAAAARLSALSGSFPGRMFCPLDRYVAGGEKELLLRSTDFCLLPSRFEPCGLVDIEFGWNGSVIIGHDTGGLGKMPGVYFTAQASHLAHLARKFEAAFDEAMALSVSARHDMTAQALARRFPVDEMMAAYADTWQQTLKGRLPQQQQQEQAANYFADKWQRCNKGTAAGTSAATAAKDPAAITLGEPSCSAAERCSSHGGNANSIGTGSVSVDCSAFLSPFYRKGSSSSSGRLQQLPQPARRGDELQRAYLSKEQRWTNRLLVVLQHFSLGPGILLLSFMLLEDVLVGSKTVCGMHMHDNLLTWLPRGMDQLGPSFIGFFILSTGAFILSTGAFILSTGAFILSTGAFILSTGAFILSTGAFILSTGAFILSTGAFILSTAFAPVWFWLGSKVKPAMYIRAAALLVVASYLLAFVAMYASGIITLAVGLVACTNLVSAPILSMGLLGEEGVDVFEVGRGMLTLGECVKYGLLAAAMVAAAAATSALPHQLLAGCALLAAVAIATWLCCPAALTQAYQHMNLNYRRQWLLLKHLRCFWLSLAAGACDTLALLLTGFLVVAVTDSLAVLAAFQAIAFGCSAAAVLWNWRALSSRIAELHLNGAMLLLAGLPLYQAIKAAVLLSRLPTGVMLGVCAVVDVAMGGRSSILGLASFVTLPSREVVSMWQFLGIMVGSVSTLALVGGAYAAQKAATAAGPWLLFGLISGCEVLRAVLVLLLGCLYHQENLTAP
ncbi:hypothetical protein COO60DRAFT_1644178 [Scenedesmus sp. NREL 46B-D3]|nr:hypothetical protein COO60DRAFT_1644178 [Scenedesmus sp. NREL 46B-D3]